MLLTIVFNDLISTVDKACQKICVTLLARRMLADAPQSKLAILNTISWEQYGDYSKVIDFFADS